MPDRASSPLVASILQAVSAIRRCVENHWAALSHDRRTPDRVAAIRPYGLLETEAPSLANVCAGTTADRSNPMNASRSAAAITNGT